MFNFRCTYWKLDIIWIVYDNIINKMMLGKGEKGTTATVRFKICVPFLAYCAPFRNKANF